MKKTSLLIQLIILFLFNNCIEKKPKEELLKSLDNLDKYIKSNKDKEPYQTDLILLDDTIKGKVKEFEQLCYSINGSDSVFIGANSYKYFLKNNRILEEQWFGQYINNKPLTWKYYYSKSNIVPDSIIVDNFKDAVQANIGKEFGEMNIRNTFNTIDDKDFLIKQLQISSNVLIKKNVFNYDSLGRLKEIYYKSINLRDLYTSGDNKDSRVFSKIYEYEGNTKAVKYIYELTDNEVASKYDKNNYPENATNINYDEKKNWIFKKIAGTVYIRNIKYQ